MNFAIALSVSDSASEEADEHSVKSGLRMDEPVFRTFYERTAGPLLGYLMRACGERALAEDLWQEAYCRFLTSAAPEMDERQARSYLFQIATNLMRDRWRRPREEAPAAGVAEAASNEPPLDLKLGMRQAFDRLKPRERQLLWLAYVEGSNHKEIADCTGLQAGSIRLLLFRARRKLAGLVGASARRGDAEVTK
ncbi:MAG: RNA polymerase sigma factor [Candidatus Sulfotelmatobacter sp.]